MIACGRVRGRCGRSPGAARQRISLSWKPRGTGSERIAAGAVVARPVKGHGRPRAARDGQDPRVVVEGVLHPVAVMRVDVDVEDALEPLVQPGQHAEHRVVQVAEAAERDPAGRDVVPPPGNAHAARACQPRRQHAPPARGRGAAEDLAVRPGCRARRYGSAPCPRAACCVASARSRRRCSSGRGSGELRPGRHRRRHPTAAGSQPIARSGRAVRDARNRQRVLRPRRNDGRSPRRSGRGARRRIGERPLKISPPEAPGAGGGRRPPLEWASMRLISAHADAVPRPYPDLRILAHPQAAAASPTLEPAPRPPSAQCSSSIPAARRERARAAPSASGQPGDGAAAPPSAGACRPLEPRHFGSDCRRRPPPPPARASR